MEAIENSASQFKLTANDNIPESVDICGINIKIQCNNQSKHILQISIDSEEMSKALISCNHVQNTGFLMSTSLLIFSCSILTVRHLK